MKLFGNAVLKCQFLQLLKQNLSSLFKGVISLFFPKKYNYRN